MNGWRQIHKLNTSREPSPTSSRLKKTAYTPARSQRDHKQNSFIHTESCNGEKIRSPENIKFSYQASMEWIIKMKKALRLMFKQFRNFCKSIEKQIQKMNSKYRRLTEFYINNPTLLQLISETSSPKKDDISGIMGKMSSSIVTLEKGLESNWGSKVLDREQTKNKTQKLGLQINRSQSFNHNEIKRSNTERKCLKNSERQPSQRNSVMNKVKNQKLNDSFVEMNQRLEIMKRILDGQYEDFV